MLLNYFGNILGLYKRIVATLGVNHHYRAARAKSEAARPYNLDLVFEAVLFNFGFKRLNDSGTV